MEAGKGNRSAGSLDGGPKTSAAPPITAAGPALVLIPVEVLNALQESLRRIEEAISTGASAVSLADVTEQNGYEEPGPHSVRKWFTVEELTLRWGMQKSKIYAFTSHELPWWSQGRSGRQFFWAYVWMFEKRMTRDQADAIYKGIHAVQTR